MRGIYEYIAFNAFVTDGAFLPILRKQGYRVVIIDRHLVFYKINEEDKLVIIYAIVDGRREYRNLM